MFRLLAPLAGIVLLFIACGGEESGELLEEFPLEYQIDSVNVLGTHTYFFTDTIIFLTTNDLVDNIDMRGMQIVDSLLFNNDTSLNNFFLQNITFLEAGTVSLNGNGINMNTSYTELSGIGRIDAFGGLGFKVNPGLENMVSCFTVTSKRSIDTLFEDNFVPGLDTLYNQDSTFAFQLEIVEDSNVELGYCDPFTENDLVEDFSARNGLQNQDRIVSYRVDLIYKKN